MSEVCNKTNGRPTFDVDWEYCGLTVCWREKGHEGKCIGPSGEFDAVDGACAALLADLKALRLEWDTADDLDGVITRETRRGERRRS